MNFVVVSESDPNVQGVEGIVHRARRRERRARQEATTDALTGLGNQRAWLLTRDRYSEHAYAVARFDVNGLKFVNDTFGHAAGDVLIQAMASRIAFYCSMFGVSDRHVFRTGGDEFTVVGPHRALQAVVNELRDCRSLATGLGLTESEADAQMYEHKRAQKQKV